MLEEYIYDQLLVLYGWCMVVPWLRRLVAGLSPRRLGFTPGSVRVGFLVGRGRVAGDRFLSEFFSILLSVSLHHGFTLSSGGGGWRTIHLLLATVQTPCRHEQQKQQRYIQWGLRTFMYRSIFMPVRSKPLQSFQPIRSWTPRSCCVRSNMRKGAVWRESGTHSNKPISQNKIVYCKETIECRRLIFLPGSQGRVHCHTVKIGATSEGYSRPVPLSAARHFVHPNEANR
jgi:hypothetical protein